MTAREKLRIWAGAMLMLTLVMLVVGGFTAAGNLFNENDSVSVAISLFLLTSVVLVAIFVPGVIVRRFFKRK